MSNETLPNKENQSDVDFPHFTTARVGRFQARLSAIVISELPDRPPLAGWGSLGYAHDKGRRLTTLSRFPGEWCRQIY